MRLTILAFGLLLVPGVVLADRPDLFRSIENRDETTWKTAVQIWEWAEPGYQETKSSAALMSLLEDSGFQIEKGVAEIPTAFTATFGSGKPVIGILGEFDALPGLSQTGNPFREQREKTDWGHGCGHHLFGVASASAAIAVKEQIETGTLQGTIRFYGCPAEEGGAAKLFMVRAGLFKDCDAVLHWHPSSVNTAGEKATLSRIAVKFRFHGKSAHAAGSPDQGRSALDAVELTNHAAQLMREHTPDFTRIHHVITSGGAAPNVVPDFAEVYYYVRHPSSEVVKDLYRRLELCAKAGALATETRLEVEYLGGVMEMLPNQTLTGIALKNLKELNDLKYTPEDYQFAVRLQEQLEKPQPLESIQQIKDVTGEASTGSTDVADVSWVVPTGGFTTACWVPGTPGHSWQAVACGVQPCARKGMNLAAKVLAACAWDLFTQPALLKQARQEHRTRVEKQPYVPMISPEQQPPLDYRNPPKR